jgi:hypothetical protein
LNYGPTICSGACGSTCDCCKYMHRFSLLPLYITARNHCQRSQRHDSSKQFVVFGTALLLLSFILF